MTVGILAIAVNSACFTAGAFGAAANALPTGQREAPRSLDLEPWQMAFLILLPQMIRIAASPVAGYRITRFGIVSYLAVIGVPEMLGAAFDHALNTVRDRKSLSIATAIVLLYCLLIVFPARRLEARMRRVPAR